MLLFSGCVATPQEANEHRHDHPRRAGTKVQPQLQANVGRDRHGCRRTPDGKGGGSCVVLQSAAEGETDKSAVGNDSHCTVLCCDSAPADHYNSQWEDSIAEHSAGGATCDIDRNKIFVHGDCRDSCLCDARTHPRDDCCDIELASVRSMDWMCYMGCDMIPKLDALLALLSRSCHFSKLIVYFVFRLREYQADESLCCPPP